MTNKKKATGATPKNAPDKHEEKVVYEDGKRFLTDDEFESIRSKLEHVYFESAKMFPKFDPDTRRITAEQAGILSEYLFKRCTPYYEAQRRLERCIMINAAFRTND